MEVKGPCVEDFVWPGKVTQVIDPHCFWIQIRSTENLNPFEHLQQTIQSFCCHQASRVSSIEELEPDQLVLVDHENEAPFQWKRGQVVRITSGNSVEVFFVDYGNTELVAANKLCTKFPPQFKAVPPQAVRCSLAGVKPISKSWTTRGIRTFQRLTTGHLSVLILSMELSHSEVSLYASSNENKRSVSHLLLDEEVAMPYEGHEVPEYLDDIPAFMSSLYMQNQCYMVQSKNTDMVSKALKEDKVTTKTLASLPSCTDKYVPPHHKSTASYVQSSDQKSVTQSGDSRSSSTGVKNKGQCQTAVSRDMKSSSNNLSPKSKRKDPVVDFFPFENVSVYPPSPVSPLKLSGKAASGQDQSPPMKTQHNSSSLNKRTSDSHGNIEEVHNTSSKSPVERHDKHRFAANFNNLPPNDQEFCESSFFSNNSSSRALGSNAGGTDKSVSYDPEAGSPGQFRPRIYSSLTPPQYYSYTGLSTINRNPNDLLPPGYFQHLISSSGYQSGYSFGAYGQSNLGNQLNLSHMYNQPNLSQQKAMLPIVNSAVNEENNGARKYEKASYSSPEKQKDGNSVMARQQSQEQRSVYSGNNSTESSKMALKLTIPQNHASSKYSSYDRQRPAVECPDSPAIAAFNLGDIDHTNALTTDHFKQRNYQEKLHALQEEAEDIARESAEQSSLMNISRYGRRSDKEEDRISETDYHGIDHDLLEQVAEEIRQTNKEHEELKKLYAVKNGLNKPAEKTVRLESIPSSYISDIDFSNAVQEALDFGKTNGMENAKDLLEAIVESLKATQAEKQLNDVLSMLLSKAIKEFNLYHEIVLETINRLNDEMEIKECLTKVLKTQQAEFVREPRAKTSYHQEFSRVMGQLYNISLEWSDSNAIVQDGILGIVEKWIVFNNKGMQIGQADKENVFLDCFVSFWEISGHEILRHNQSFRSRILSEIRKKLLNEGVSRSIRERLLDIMMEMFSLNVERRDIHTQTSHRTMIPSSCQVKPSVCDKGTFTKSDWSEEIFSDTYSDDRLDSLYFDKSDDYVPEPIVHLRPLCAAEAKINAPKSSPPTGSDNLFSPVSSLNAKKDLSGISDIQESNFMSPQESANESIKDLENLLCEQTLEPVLLVDIPERVSVNTVTEKKSALGKSIVDWFEYEPPAKDSSETTLDVKQLDCKKKQDSTYMEASEHGVKLKYSLPKSDKGQKKSPKDKNEVKKSRKMENNMNIFENIYKGCEKVHVSSNQVDHMPVKVTKDTETSENIQPKFESKANCYTTIGNKAFDNQLDNWNLAKAVDWWGAGEMPTAICASKVSDFVDNGPDVIIEGELEDNLEDENKTDDICSQSKKTVDTEFDESAQREFVVSEHVDEEAITVTGKQFKDDFGFESDEDDNSVADFDEEPLNTAEDFVGLATAVGKKVAEKKADLIYNVDFPELDLNAPVNNQDQNNSTSANADAISEYDRNFPKPNLADFLIHEDFGEERPESARWTPGRRKCLLCHEESHITEKCPNSFLLLH